MSEEIQEKISPINRIWTGFGTVLCIVFGFMLICNLTIIIKGILNPDTPPSLLGITPMVTLSGSMSGEQKGHIEVGDLIFVGKAEPEALNVSDVISYKEGSVIVTHRIMEVQTAEDGSIQWITKGDANNTADARPVSADKLVGKCIARIPKLGDAALFLQKPLGMCLVIGIPVLLFVLYDLLYRQKRAKEENQKTAEMQAEIERLRALAGETSENEI